MQYAFHDLSADSFPFVISYIDPRTRKVIDTLTIEGPGVVHIPARSSPVDVRVDFANGESVYQPAPKDQEAVLDQERMLDEQL